MGKVLRDVPIANWYVGMPIEIHIKYGITSEFSEFIRPAWSGDEPNEDFNVEWVKGEIKYIPWCDYVASETESINEDLFNLNKNGYLTINSQPRVNGIPSDSKNGWGGPNGFLYQKEYIEFFCRMYGKEFRAFNLDGSWTGNRMSSYTYSHTLAVGDDYVESSRFRFGTVKYFEEFWSVGEKALLARGITLNPYYLEGLGKGKFSF